MKARDIVRTVVVKTNPYWPFSSLNKMPYYLAIRGFIRLCRKFPEIKSTYLRHGLTEQNWVPALSDIDFTIITDSKLTLDEEFLFLSSFWNDYDKLKRLFPMLGDVEILDDELIGTWTRFNIRGYESRNWRLIHGIETAKSNYALNSTRLAIDSLNNALRIYLDHFLRRFFKKESPPFITLQEMKRVAFKSLRYANYRRVDTAGCKLERQVDDTMDMLSCLLEELTKAVRPFTVHSRNGSTKKPGEPQNAVQSWHVRLQHEGLDTRDLEPFSEQIDGIFFTPIMKIVILKSGLDPAAMKGCIGIVNRFFSKLNGVPVIASPSIFEYMIRFYNPFLYHSLVTSDGASYRKDLLFDIKPPGVYHFINKILEQTGNMLTFPQSRALISFTNPSWLSEVQLDSILKRSLFIKLYLEKRVIKLSYGELLAESQCYYADCYARLKEIKGLRDKALTWEAFKLLKSITNDIHMAVPTSDSLDKLLKIEEEII